MSFETYEHLISILILGNRIGFNLILNLFLAISRERSTIEVQHRQEITMGNVK